MKGLLILLALMLTGCGENMVQQPRYDHYEQSEIFANGMAMQAPPEGTRDRSPLVFADTAQQPEMSRALLDRGRERHDIFCAMCHAHDGSGNGTIPARGYPRPPAYQSAGVRAASNGKLFDIITNGYGVMYGHGDRISPPDRWAIIAWIRTLQSLDKQKAANER